MKKKSNTIAKIFALVMITMILLPILLSTSRALVGYVEREIYKPWKAENDAAYEHAKSTVIDLMSQY